MEIGAPEDDPFVVETCSAIFQIKYVALMVKLYKIPFIYRRSSPIYPFVFTTGNVSKIPQFIDVTKPTVIVFHGWSGSGTSAFMRNVTAVYLSRVSVEMFFFCLVIKGMGNKEK
jgi:predicted alpha/beta-fold hydrolase